MRDSATSRTCRSPREALLRRQRLPIEAPRRRDATNRHGKACRARLGGSASRAARATPSVTCASRLSRLACCLHRALDPVDRPARCDGGRLLRYDSAGPALRVGAGRAPPTFEPEPAVPVWPTQPPPPPHASQSRGAGGHQPALCAARAQTYGGVLARSILELRLVCRPHRLSCVARAAATQPARGCGLAPPQQGAVLLSGLLVPGASIFVRLREPGHLSCCAASHRNRGRHDARRVSIPRSC